MKEDIANNQHKEFVKLLIKEERSQCSEYAHHYFKQTNSERLLYEEYQKIKIVGLDL
jgi:hypothetical protein